MTSDMRVMRGSYTQPVFLERMPQQVGLLGAEDDWTGLKSAAERRRLQNRIHQRAYRKRKLNGAKRQCLTPPKSSASSTEPSDPSPHDRTANFKDVLENKRERHLQEDESWQLWQLWHSAAGSSKINRSQMARVAAVCKLGCIETEQTISAFERWAETQRNPASPRTDLILVLVKFNIFRAMISNSKDLGYGIEESLEDDDALSHFTDPTNPKNKVVVMPLALQPTQLQREIPHHPWIDLLPIPAMRDNLLRAGDTYDEMELCSDLVGYFSPSTGRTGMIIWGEPWDPSGWEVTESFLRCWGWTIRGCRQLFEATNYWRARRGEGPLVFERLLCEEIVE